MENNLEQKKKEFGDTLEGRFKYYMWLKQVAKEKDAADRPKKK